MDMDYPLSLGDIRVFRTRKHHPVSYLAVILAGETPFSAVIVDGTATVDPYWMVRVCKRHGFDEKDVLKKVWMARGFTAYQMKELMCKAENIFRENASARFLGVIGLSERFADDDLGVEEGIWLRSQTVEHIRRLVGKYRLYCPVADTEPKIFIRRCGGDIHGKECAHVQAGTGQDNIRVG